MRLLTARTTWLKASFVCCTLAWGAARAAAAERPTSEADLPAWVEKTVQERQPTAAERRFDEIGWLTDIREAIRLAKQHQRPILLFTHDGHMAIGRC
jgi:hypothetical protein